jgi:hypothetical protein
MGRRRWRREGLCRTCQPSASCVYDETKSCGSAADFLLGVAINAGKDDQIEGGLEGEIGPELDLKEEGVVVDLFGFMLDNNKSKRLIHCNLQHLSVSAAKKYDLEMKGDSHLRTQAALKKSHDSAMAELMLSHRSKMDELTSTHEFNLDAEKINLHQCISSERKLQNALYNVVLDSRQIKKQDACKSVRSTKKVAAQ